MYLGHKSIMNHCGELKWKFFAKLDKELKHAPMELEKVLRQRHRSRFFTGSEDYVLRHCTTSQ